MIGHDDRIDNEAISTQGYAYASTCCFYVNYQAEVKLKVPTNLALHCFMLCCIGLLQTTANPSRKIQIHVAYVDELFVDT